LLFLEPAQRVLAIFVKRAIAARPGVKTTAAEAMLLHAGAHAVHLPLHPLHLVLPTALIPATHFSAPERVDARRQTARRPQDEAKHRQNNPTGVPSRFKKTWRSLLAGAAVPTIEMSGVGHVPLQ